MTPELAQAKKRMTLMAVVNVACVIVAMAAIVMVYKFGFDWAFFLFGGALLAGFGTQIWFIAGFRRKGA